MSNQSVANNTSGAQMEQTPAISTFQFDQESIGKIKDSVNMYRGTVNLPINLVSLPGLKDLDVNLMILYGSNIKNNAAQWNITQPTSVLGLGWTMPGEKIVVNKRNAGTQISDEYYLVSSGSGNQLVQSGTASGGALVFQARNYEFWQILYYPATEKWVITKEDGTVWTYGDKASNRNTVAYGVSWGNWIGDSALTAGQQQYASAWSLSEKQNTWGNSVLYEYDVVNQYVGSTSGGKQFTQASYIKQITDSQQRKLVFNYGEKYGALNPSPQGIIEYQAQNNALPNPNAYQDAYETRYLSSVDVKSASNNQLFSIFFGFDFINLSATSDPVHNLLYKRVLTQIWQVSPDGSVLPGIDLAYYTASTDINPGALKSITYPYGATATYTYKGQQLSTSRNLQAQSPLAGSVPRVWFGPDYTVITWYNQSTKQMTAQVYSWSGSWVTTQLSSSSSAAQPFANVDFDMSTLGVVAQNESIVLYFTNKANNSLELYLYTKNQNQYGSYNLVNGAIRMPLKAGAGASLVTVGDNFVVAFNKNFSSQPFYGYQWNWKQRFWVNMPLLPPFSTATSASNVTMSARDNYYMVCMYDNVQKVGKMQLFYHDGQNQWKSSNQWNDSFTVYKDPQEPTVFPYLFSPQAGYVVATYISAIDSQNVSYGLRIYQWDTNYNILSPGTPVARSYTSPIVSGQSQFQVLQTFANNQFIANNPNLNRYIGGPGTSNNPQNWLQKSFTTSASNTYTFASGDDFDIMSQQSGSTATNTYYQFNPNSPNAGGWGTAIPLGSTGTNPTMANDFITAGTDIFYRNGTGQVTKLAQKLNNLAAPQTVQNRGPEYIAYQDNTGNTAQTYITFLLNGQASNPTKLPIPNGATGQKLYVDQTNVQAGTILAGPTTLVTYPADKTFDTSTYLNIYKIVDQAASGAIAVQTVAYIEIANPFDATQSFLQAYNYSGGPGSIISYDPNNSLAQFPQVQVVPGVKDPTISPKPNGNTVYYFSNGVSPQSISAYPNSWVYNYNLLLNGTLLAKQLYDAKGVNVASETNYWQLFENDPSGTGYLNAAYFRLTKVVTMQDQVTKTTNSSYSATTGQILTTEYSYYGSDSVQKIVSVQKTYADQIPQYSAAIKQMHLYTAVVQETTIVYSADRSQQTITSSNVTTWQNWVNGNSGAWAPLGNSRWLGAGTPTFDFTPNALNTGWLTMQTIVNRNNGSGTVTEQVNVDGMHTSYLYDTSGVHQIAEFPDASFEYNEAGYYSFESIESAGVWQIGANAAIIPNTSFATVDAHTGTQSLQINPTTAGNNGISGSYTPTGSQTEFVFSCFAKKPSGFNAGQGDAQWTITLLQNNAPIGNPIVLSFPSQTGEWKYIWTTIDISGYGPDPVTIQIQATNANTATYVLVDNLRFTPVSCALGAVNYESVFYNIDAYLGANGETKQVIFDSFQRQVAATNNADSVDTMQTFYFSRSGNNNLFNAADPNSSVFVQAADGGTLQTFTNGNQWQQCWQGGASDTWEVQNGQLVLTNFTQQGTLTLAVPDYTNQYSIGAAVTSPQAVTTPLGIKIGTQYTLQWNPAQNQWQLLDSNNGVLQSNTFRTITLPGSLPQNGTIDAKTASRFLTAGYHVPNVEIHTENGVTTIHDTVHHRSFSAIETNGGIQVSPFGNEWLLLTGTNYILFYVDGKCIFSYVSEAAINGVPQFFAGNSIAFDAIINAKNNRVNITYTSNDGNNKQSQLLFNNQASIIENIYDSLGRAAINTKAAFVSPTEDSPLFAYNSNFANYNWATNSMTGIITDYYPEDGGYPYFQRVYETSSLARVVEQAMPGADFCVGQHTLKIQYTTNDNSLGLQAYQYYQVNVTDQNGNKSFSITDKRGNPIYKINQKDAQTNTVITVFNGYDDFGNPVQQKTPNYFNPPAGTTASDWIVTNGYDFLGRQVTQATIDAGTSKMIYDNAGRLRFKQNQQGATDGNYQYVKYNQQGNAVEMGYIQGAWNQQQLETEANEQNLPTTPNTWRKQYFYNGNGTQNYQLCRLTNVWTNNGNNGTAGTKESFGFDILGHVTNKTVWNNTYDAATEFTIGYTYNNMNDVLQITYPNVGQSAPQSVYYTYNEIGQLKSLGDSAQQPDNIAAYTYNPSGKPLTAAYNQYGTKALNTEYEYNSPVWLQRISSNLAGDAAGSLFSENIEFAPNVAGKQNYYNGQISSVEYNYNVGTPYQSGQSFAYDGISALSTVTAPDNSGQRQFGYDNNSNFGTVVKGTDTYQYLYNQGNAVSFVKNQAGTATYFQYQYDENGNVKNAGSSANGTTLTQSLGFTYDPATVMTSIITDELNAGKTYTFEYDGGNQRIIKQALQAGSATSTKLYLRGASSSPLAEVTKDAQGNTTTVFYIYGPMGMVAMYKNNQRYSLVQDHLNSVRMVIDNAGTVSAAYDYDQFGTLKTLTETAANFVSYLFTGQEFDVETGLYNFKARFYFSEIGRFGATDKAAQFFSPYVYAGNNPLSYSDPSGYFSIGNFFSAIAGAIIGAIEILIGIVIDVVAGFLEVVTGGLSTPASVGLAALSGVFYGAGISALTYSVTGLITNDFSWKDYGINMGIGAAAGAISAGFSALGSIAAEGATGIKAAADAGQAVSRIAKVANAGIDAGFKVAGASLASGTSTFLGNAAYGNDLTDGLGEAFIKGAISGTLDWAIPSVEYKAGWGNLGKRVAGSVAKSEAIGVTMQVGDNIIQGNNITDGLQNTIVDGLIGGSIGGIGAGDYGKEQGTDFKNMFKDISF